MHRVLIAHPSQKQRKDLSIKISRNEDAKVVSRVRSASNFFEEVEKTDPDVVLIGTEFRQLSGLDLIDRLMVTNPLPVLVIEDEATSETVKAFSYGALDFVSSEDSIEEISALVEMAAEAEDFRWRDADPVVPETPSTTGKGVVIGGSTGGPGALEVILENLPGDFPAPVFVAQHMSGNYTGEFAQRLDNLCGLKVKEAEDGEKARQGVAYLSPGDRDMEIREGKVETRISLEEPGSGEVPSIDRLFRSVSEVYREKAVAVVLSGMGNDGALGARYLRSVGSTLIVQDEETSSVYGIGKHVVKQGDADYELPVEEIPGRIVRCL